jgi:hypothetical protein
MNLFETHDGGTKTVGEGCDDNISAAMMDEIADLTPGVHMHGGGPIKNSERRKRSKAKKKDPGKGRKCPKPNCHGK